jgi:outer membrane protein OmpA-like peptidoglycan-associated protein
MKAKGYGESQLINECADGVDCSEELHQQNRRTEFKIIQIKED